MLFITETFFSIACSYQLSEPKSNKQLKGIHGLQSTYKQLKVETGFNSLGHWEKLEEKTLIMDEGPSARATQISTHSSINSFF